jgi:hypothetical protein
MWAVNRKQKKPDFKILLLTDACGNKIASPLPGFVSCMETKQNAVSRSAEVLE